MIIEYVHMYQNAVKNFVIKHISSFKKCSNKAVTFLLRTVKQCIFMSWNLEKCITKAAGGMNLTFKEAYVNISQIQ